MKKDFDESRGICHRYALEYYGCAYEKESTILQGEFFLGYSGLPQFGTSRHHPHIPIQEKNEQGGADQGEAEYHSAVYLLFSSTFVMSTPRSVPDRRWTVGAREKFWLMREAARLPALPAAMVSCSCRL